MALCCLSPAKNRTWRLRNRGTGSLYESVAMQSYFIKNRSWENNAGVRCTLALFFFCNEWTFVA